MRRRVAQAAVMLLLAVVMLGADGTEARFERIGHKLMCACSCGQILLECNHVGCPDSDRMIGELRGQVASGVPETGVFNWFVNKYGAVVLAAPIRGGFDTVAWIAPIAVFVLGTLGTGVLVRRWVGRRTVLQTASGGGAGLLEMSPERQAMQERIRLETEL